MGNIELDKVLGDMVKVAADILKADWAAARSHAEPEFRKLAETAVKIELGKLNGTISESAAKHLVNINLNALKAVVLALQGLGILAAEKAVNAAIDIARTALNTATGWTLLGNRLRRVTIDEKLHPGCIRVAVAEALPGVEEVALDGTGGWGVEVELRITPDVYEELLGVTSVSPVEAARLMLGADVPAEGTAFVPWHALKEGQVYLAGRFRVVAVDGAPHAVAPGGENPGFLRIDNLPVVRDGMRKAYARAVTDSSALREPGKGGE